MMAKIVSPCIKVCVMDESRGLCRGCGRTLDEIATWTQLTDVERHRIIAAARSRLAGLTAVLDGLAGNGAQ